MHRSTDEFQARLAGAFIDWGMPTADVLKIVRQTAPDLLMFASGGLRNGIDIAKCIALGARLGGMASPFLKAAAKSLDALRLEIQLIKREIQVAMFATGAGNLDQLRETGLIEEGHEQG
jgi:isopentenyl-diphosphate delta-isomerase